MKKIFISLLVLFSVSANAQQTLLYAKQVQVKDSLKLGGVWRSTWPAAAAAGWNLTGNAGINESTNFIGTTDNKIVPFRTNNLLRGQLQTDGKFFWFYNANINGISFGRPFGETTNLAIGGVASSTGWVSGTNSAIVGQSAALSNTTGGGITALGSNALRSNTTGSNNTGIGANAGRYNTTGSNQTFFGNLGRTDYNGDTSATPIVIFENATASLNRIKVNGLLQVINTNTTGNTQNIEAPSLTNGTGLEINSNSSGFNSNNGLLYVNNSGISVNGILARFRANSTAGSGVTIKASGNTGFGTATPVYTVDIVGGFKLTNGSQAVGRVLTSDATGYATWAAPVAGAVTLNEARVAYGNSSNVLTYSSALMFDGSRFSVTAGYDGVALSEGIIDSESGLYGNGNNEIIAAWDANNQKYIYADGYLNWDQGNSKLLVGGRANIADILNLGNAPDYANNAAAIGGGLIVGDIYRTGDILKIVH